MNRLLTQAGESQTRFETNEGVSMDWLVDDSLVADAGISVARMTLTTGARSQGHRHPNCNEVIHLIEGTVNQMVGPEEFPMASGDTIFIPAGCYHQTTNTGAGDATMIVSYSAGTRIYEAGQIARSTTEPAEPGRA